MRGGLLLDDYRVEGGAVVSRFHGVYPADTHDLKDALRRDRFFREIDDYIRKARDRADIQAVVPGNSYTVNTGSAAQALAAATAETLLYVLAGTANQPSLAELCVGFDGVTASAVPALVELCYGTAATNSTPGTGSTSFTPLQGRGWPAQTSQSTAANNVSSEPTVLVSHRQWLVTPNGGLLIVQFPLGREPTGNVTASTTGKMLAVRATAPAIVNARGYVEYDE